MNIDDIRKSGSGNRIIAVDFDGTLFTHPKDEGLNLPEVGLPKHDIIDLVKAKQNEGWKIILWTCREDEALFNAVSECQKVGLKFDAVNNTIPENEDTNSRKIYATVYIDDRSINPIDICKKENLIDLDIDLDEKIILQLALCAHERNITLNQLIVEILERIVNKNA